VAVVVGLSIMIYRRHAFQIFNIAALFATVIASIVLFRPWWPFHFMFFSFPISIMAGFGIAELLSKAIQKTRSAWTVGMSMEFKPDIPLMLGGAIISLWMAFEVSQSYLIVATQKASYSHNIHVLRVLNNYKGHIQWIYTRNNGIAAQAGFMLPPEITDLSKARYLENNVNEEYIVNVVEQYNCEVLILTDEDIGNIRWQKFVQTYYTLVDSNGGEAIFVTNKLKPSPMPKPGDFLKGYNL
jgi:hypothetical protein